VGSVHPTTSVPPRVPLLLPGEWEIPKGGEKSGDNPANYCALASERLRAMIRWREGRTGSVFGVGAYFKKEHVHTEGLKPQY
jgi:hypothetical protein